MLLSLYLFTTSSLSTSAANKLTGIMSNTLFNSVSAASADIIATARSLRQTYDGAVMKFGSLDEFTKKKFLKQWSDDHTVRFCSFLDSPFQIC